MRAALAILLVLAPLASADADLCRPTDLAGIVEVRCSSVTYPDGQTERETEIEVRLDHDAPVAPSFFVQVSFQENEGPAGSAARCGVYYQRLSGAGPLSIEWGAHCVYPFHLVLP